MKDQASPGIQMFVAVGLFILAWRLLPAGDWHPLSKIMAGLPAFMGAALLIGAAGRSARRATPWWQGLIGRAFAVTALWGLTITAASFYGTPHLLYQYHLRDVGSVCVYLGWNGIVPITDPALINNACPVLLLVHNSD
ncbi:MAG: hypothetical protein ACFCUR_09775 [Rhodomicrobiaceae bacterium]